MWKWYWRKKSGYQIDVCRRDETGLRKIGNRNGYVGQTTLWNVYHFHNGDSDNYAWSPDGEWIYYTAQFGQAVDMKGNVQRLTHSDETKVFEHPVLRQLRPETKTSIRNTYISFSHNGKWIAFTSTRIRRHQIYVMPSEGGDAYQLTYVDDGWSARSAGWRPLAVPEAINSKSANQEEPMEKK